LPSRTTFIAEFSRRIIWLLVERVEWNFFGNFNENFFGKPKNIKFLVQSKFF
jgi:hypothetical protein